MFAALFLPLPQLSEMGLVKNAHIRAVMVGVALRLLSDEKGWDTAIVTQPELCSMLGWTKIAAASDALKALVEMNVLNQTTHGRGVNGRFSVRALGSNREEEVDRYAGTVDAFVDGTWNPLADAIRSVTHPVWAHSSALNLTHWLLLVAEVACLSPAQFKFNTRMRKKYRADLVRFGLLADETANAQTLPADPRTLLQILDDLAINSELGAVDPATDEARSPLALQSLAYAERQLVKAERAALVTDWRRQDLSAHEAIKLLLSQHKIPAPPDSSNQPRPRRDDEDAQKLRLKRVAAFNSWIQKMRAEIEHDQPNEAFLSRGGAILEARMVAKHYGPVFAEKTARQIMRGEAIA